MRVALRAAPTPTRDRLKTALATCVDPANLRRTIPIALVVGIVLTLINQLDVLVAGRATALTAVKIGLNFCVPFVVSNAGLLTGIRSRTEPRV
jgi:hypothetical protein